MKSKFIEGTDKQYSINEKGVVRVHYFKTKSIIYKKGKLVKGWTKKNSNETHYKINGAQVSAKKLIRDTFNIYYCVICGKKTKYEDSINSRSCPKCKEKASLRGQRKWRKNNLELARKRTKVIFEKHKENLGDAYITSHLFKTEMGSIPEYIIDLKRQQISLHRELKKQKQNDTN